MHLPFIILLTLHIIGNIKFLIKTPSIVLLNIIIVRLNLNILHFFNYFHLKD